MIRVHHVSFIAGADHRRLERVSPLTHDAVYLRWDHSSVILGSARDELVIIVDIYVDDHRSFVLEPCPEGFPCGRLIEEDGHLFFFIRVLVDPELELLSVLVDYQLFGICREQLLPSDSCQREELISFDILVRKYVLHHRIRDAYAAVHRHSACRYRQIHDKSIIHIMVSRYLKASLSASISLLSSSTL